MAVSVKGYSLYMQMQTHGGSCHFITFLVQIHGHGRVGQARPTAGGKTHRRRGLSVGLLGPLVLGSFLFCFFFFHYDLLFMFSFWFFAIF
jgi:hypothetical protein